MSNVFDPQHAEQIEQLNHLLDEESPPTQGISELANEYLKNTLETLIAAEVLADTVQGTIQEEVSQMAHEDLIKLFKVIMDTKGKMVSTLVKSEALVAASANLRQEAGVSADTSSALDSTARQVESLRTSSNPLEQQEARDTLQGLQVLSMMIAQMSLDDESGDE